MGNVDAVGAVSAGGNDLVQKDDFSVGFAHRRIVITHAGEQVGEMGVLVLVNGVDWQLCRSVSLYWHQSMRCRDWLRLCWS